MYIYILYIYMSQPTLVYCDPLVLLCTLYRYTDKPDHASTSYKCITVSNPSSPSLSMPTRMQKLLSWVRLGQDYWPVSWINLIWLTRLDVAMINHFNRSQKTSIRAPWHLSYKPHPSISPRGDWRVWLARLLQNYFEITPALLFSRATLTYS